MRQVWRHLGFLHWPVDRDAVARLLPPTLEVDTFAGAAYLGIVPFTIPLTRTPRLGVPMAPAFHEINLRTYVHRGGSDPGVWFFSLEATSRLAVAGARLAYGLPYFHARIDLVERGSAALPLFDYRARRRSPGGAGGAPGFRCRYGPIGPAAAAAPGTLEFFLAERYLLYSLGGGVLRTARVSHPPYPLQLAAATAIDETLARAAGLPPLEGAPPLVHYAREVDVRIYRPQPAPAGP